MLKKFDKKDEESGESIQTSSFDAWLLPPCYSQFAKSYPILAAKIRIVAKNKQTRFGLFYNSPWLPAKLAAVRMFAGSPAAEITGAAIQHIGE